MLKDTSKTYLKSKESLKIPQNGLIHRAKNCISLAGAKIRTSPIEAGGGGGGEGREGDVMVVIKSIILMYICTLIP